MLKVITLALSTVLFSSMSLACTKPTAPSLPDANTAVTAQMVKAKNEVKAYMTQAEAYLECAADTQSHNLVVDEMQKTADAFNAAVRAYKTRMSNA
jgi:hypothetical protein